MKPESHVTLKSQTELKHFKLCYRLRGQMNIIIDSQVNDYINLVIVLLLIYYDIFIIGVKAETNSIFKFFF